MRRIRFSHLVCASLLAAAVGSLSIAHRAHADQALVIRDFVLSHGIDEREPIDTTDSFLLSDQRAYAFLRINNLGTPTIVSFVWYYEDRVHAAIELEIGTSPGWRTWTSVNLRPGQWRVELLGHDGLVLAEHSFMAAPSFSEFAEVTGPNSLAVPCPCSAGSTGVAPSSIRSRSTPFGSIENAEWEHGSRSGDSRNVTQDPDPAG